MKGRNFVRYVVTKVGREPKTSALSPCIGTCADNWGGAVAVSATNNDVSLASGAFIARAADDTELAGIMASLKEMTVGNTKSIAEIRTSLKTKKEKV